MTRLLICAVVAAISLGCSRSDSFAVQEDPVFSQAAFFSKVGTFPYAAPDPRRAQILSNYGRLALGMDQDAILALLGQPDLKGSVMNERRKVSNISWLYVLAAERPAPDRMETRQGVALYFGDDAKLFWVVPNGLPDLRERGSADNDTTGRFISYW